MKFKLKSLQISVPDQSKKGIFLVQFENRYNLAMTFLRYQEFYESASSKFKGKHFTILDYIEWYSKQREGNFTYPTDWAGFNIPDYVYYKVKGKQSDYNKYDACMDNIVKQIEKLNGNKFNKKFYLIGTSSKNLQVLHHELAHALYYVNKDYRLGMDKLFLKLSFSEQKLLNESFKQLGYAKSVWKDEAQAYLSTGDDYLDEHARKDFKAMFKRYIDKIKL